MTVDLVGPLRQLPVPLAPVHRETIESYLRRLAAVNHIAVDELIFAATGKPVKAYGSTKYKVDLENFARLTGVPAGLLVRTLPELAEQRRRLLERLIVQACPRCTRRHLGGPVHIHPIPHQHVCLRHNIWIGTAGPSTEGGWIMEPGPVDVSAIPEVRAAQRRHHRLLHRYGAQETKNAIETAVETWDRAWSGGLGLQQWQRVQTLRPGMTRISLQTPLSWAVRYPEIICIASVLASSYWRQVASDPWADRAAFAEIARRLHESGEPPDICLNPKRRHPLRYWSENLQFEKHGRMHPADSRNWPPEWSDELRRYFSGITFNETNQGARSQ